MKLPKWKTISSFDPKEARVSAYATIFLFLSAALMAIAFVTPSWLVSETHPNQRFRRLGLWQVCFEKFEDPYHRYDREVSGCKFIFDEDYSFISDFLSPRFFVITQVLFTAGFFILVLVCAAIMTIQQYFVIEREDLALRALSIATLLPALSSSSAIILFAIRGDDRDWMPDPEFNHISWSVFVGGFGSLILWLSSALYYLDMRRVLAEQERDHQSRHGSHYSGNAR